MNQQEVVALMKSSQSEAEWNANCDKVKRACGGYPDFWQSAIIQSGIAREIATKFGGSVDIRITKIG